MEIKYAIIGPYFDQFVAHDIQLSLRGQIH